MSDNSFFKGLLIGGLLGVAAGLLLAPKSGKETRADIRNKTEDLVKAAKEEYQQIMESAKSQAQAAMASASRIAGDVRAEVAEAAEAGKEKFEETSGRLKRAVDAGVKAYQEAKKE